jgi:alpha-tubulin suppressor-like RCC1 family protein
MLLAVTLLSLGLVTRSPGPAAAGLVPLGRIVTAMDGLTVADADGTKRHRLESAPGLAGEPYTPRWSHDGTKIAYIAAGQLCVMGANGSGNRCIFRHMDQQAYTPSWSADDRLIYFTLGGAVLSTTVDGSVQERLLSPANGFRYGAIEWSPDGRRYAVARYGTGVDGEILVGDTTGAAPLPITSGNDDSGPRWSPDGTTLAFTTHRGLFDPFKVAVVNADGSGRRVVRDGGILQAWSPNGTRLLYAGGDTQLWTVATDGTGVASVPGLRGGADWRVPGTGVVAVSAGGLHGLAVRADGSVTAWGYNLQGQLGDTTTRDRNVPGAVIGLGRTQSVSAGFLHSAAVTIDGRVLTWGWNGLGQLGLGGRTDSARPTPVAGLSGVVAVSAGLGHTLALTADGRVWAWGWNALGQLGDASTVDRLTPVLVRGLPAMTDIAAGGAHSLAIAADGTTWAWGWNGLGQLGTGSRADSLVPVRTIQPSPTSGNSMIAAGMYHSVVLARSEIWAWGWNGLGQLGNGTTTDSTIPVRAGTALAGSISAGGAHTLATGLDWSIWAWGYNGRAQLGDGRLVDQPAPVKVVAPSPILSVSAGWLHSLAVDIGGVAQSWGHNDEGELGNGSTALGRTPVRI